MWPIEPVCGIHFREVFADDMFSDIKFRVIEIEPKKFFDGTVDGIAISIKNRKYGKAIYALLLHCIDYIMNIIMRIRDALPAFLFGKNYFDLTTPKEIGWRGEKTSEYSRYISDKISKALLDKKEIFIKAYNGILFERDREKFDYSVIKFREEYWKKVEEIVGLGGGYIGVHIRRTDYWKAIEESITNIFIRKMNEISVQQPFMKFFLATDDKKEEQMLKKLYGDKLVVQLHKKWGRRGSEEMKSGIIDCLCLSRCEYILGSSGSAYSDFAARYGKKKLIVCRDE